MSLPLKGILSKRQSCPKFCEVSTSINKRACNIAANCNYT